MRVVDLQLSFPAILLALVLSALLGQGKVQLIAALVAAQYAYFARTAYGAASAERRKDYVEAALAVPLSGRRIVFRHILPNVMPPLIVVATVQIASAISLEATLSFLGLGVIPPTPTWGNMISDAQNGGYYQVAPWFLFFPSLALFVTTLAFNLLGDGLRDALDPRASRVLARK